MTVTVRSRKELVVPRSVCREAGIRSGDRLEFRVSGGIISIIPEPPSADDECTPAQRKAIDARLGESEDDFRNGRGFGPFDSAAGMVAHMKAQLRKRSASKKAKRTR